jgi:hypothetical protein
VRAWRRRRDGDRAWRRQRDGDRSCRRGPRCRRRVDGDAAPLFPTCQRGPRRRRVSWRVGLARRGCKEDYDGDDGGESDLGEERSDSRTPVQGDGRQRLSNGDASPFPSLGERSPVEHGAAEGGVCWKRGSRESAGWGYDSSTSSDDGEYIPEGGGGAESDWSSDGDGEWDDTPWTFPSTSPTEPPGFNTVTLLGPDADKEAKFRRTGGVIAGRITARHAQLCPSAYGRVKRIDELTPSDLLRLALDGSRETLRDAVIVAGRPCSEDALDCFLTTIMFFSYHRRSSMVLYRGGHGE